MIDPLERWQGLGDKPDYAGLLTFAALPYTQDPAELVGVDVAIVGAPTDDLVSDRPGARFGPRAIRAASCPPGPHLEAKVDAVVALRVVDFGDAPVIPADPVRTRDAIERDRRPGRRAPARSRSCSAATTRSPSPTSRAVAATHGPVGLVHFDTHTDTGKEVFGVEVSHGTPMYRLVESGTSTRSATSRSGCAATGPARPSSPGRPSAGSRASSCTTCATVGIREVDRADGRARRRRARCSSRSTSTCSTRPSRPAPARPSPAG